MTKDGGLVCTLSCWGIGALGGLIAMALLMLLGSFTFMQGAFVGFLVFLVAGGFLAWSLCRPLPRLGEVRLKRAELPKVEAPVVPRTGKGSAPEPVQPAAMMEEVIETVAAKAKSAAVAAQPAIDKVVEVLGMKDPKAAKAESGAATAASAPAAAAKSSALPEAAPEPSGDAGKKPALLKTARAGGADDLKKIKGVGPKLEQVLNGMGVYHYDQIAGWTEEELAWVDENIEGFKGRASRDEWVAQARELARD
jgi:predicted flap endonuclease-1-like 5' DNA nuclease